MSSADSSLLTAEHLHNYSTKAPLSIMTANPDAGLLVSCQCGNIKFKTPILKPRGMAHCHCIECRKQSASAYGTSAYFPAGNFFPLAPDFKEKLALYTRLTDSGNTLDCYFCPKCGVRLFSASFLPDGRRRDVVTIKAGCIEGLEWTGIKHIFTKSAVVDIPDHCEQYEAGLPELPEKPAKQE